MSNYIIKNIEHVVKIATTLTLSWYRGHSKAYNKLTPGIFRPEFSHLDKTVKEVELEMYSDFKINAPPFSSILLNRMII